MNTELLIVGLRQSALFIPNESITNVENNNTSSFIIACTKLGFTFSEDLFKVIKKMESKDQEIILETLKEVTGTNKNWTPLIKQWNIPTGESFLDHISTFFASVFKDENGTKLQCGHIIPDNTFPLERYNGCPFCGTPFEFEELTYDLKKSKLKVLELWDKVALKKHFKNLLESPVALDATQIESLKTLVNLLPFPKDVNVTIKENSVIAIDVLVELGESKYANSLFSNPTDILRYLWYKKTGFLQIIEPKTILKRMQANAFNRQNPTASTEGVVIRTADDLKLSYNRSECRMYAEWLTNLTLDIQKQCEIMHPKRAMWVRVIRALRLAEYSKKKGFENLKNLLDVFYRKDYEVWQAKYENFKLKKDADYTFKLLKQRPGLFARSLFANMLWFGAETTINHFKEIVNELPTRLIFTLNMYAENYFVENGQRSVKPLGGVNKVISNNPLLTLYSSEELEEMQLMVKNLTLEAMKIRYSQITNENKTVFINDALYNFPLAIGDRSESIQDLPSALMGTRFPIEGNAVRLFLQWGQGLSAQHLDMDLSARIIYENSVDHCSYSQLTTIGCQHSGDIQSIPAQIGTAEYIEINVDELVKAKAKYVVFTCNAYSNGALSPNLVVGWMNSKFPMTISEEKGVAYHPADVQHQVRITSPITKGLVFGILNVENREIIWLEMAFEGQIVQNLNNEGVKALFKKLESKLSIGDALALRCEAQDLEIVANEKDADEIYSAEWAKNSTIVSELLLG